MKIAERMLGCRLAGGIIVPLKDALQEKSRSPDSDLTGHIGELGFRCVSSITHYVMWKVEPSGKYQKYILPMEIIAGFGTVFLLAATMGKTWKHWGKNFSLIAGSHVLYNLNHTQGNKLCLALLIMIAVVNCRYALEKHRNPSLVLKSYLIHGTTMCILTMVNSRVLAKNLPIRLFKDQDVQMIYVSVSNLCFSYFLAKVIQNRMGAKSLKINWKVESLMGGASLAIFLSMVSRRSPIYEP